MDRRTIERIIGAAARCEPEDDRQAAIIGAIVRVLLDTGHFQPVKVAGVAADSMGWAMSVADNMDATFETRGLWCRLMDELLPPAESFKDRIFPQRGYPTMAEINVAAKVFTAQYNPPPESVAA